MPRWGSGLQTTACTGRQAGKMTSAKPHIQKGMCFLHAQDIAALVAGYEMDSELWYSRCHGYPACCKIPVCSVQHCEAQRLHALLCEASPMACLMPTCLMSSQALTSTQCCQLTRSGQSCLWGRAGPQHHPAKGAPQQHRQHRDVLASVQLGVCIYWSETAARQHDLQPLHLFTRQLEWASAAVFDLGSV
jgi:hypothetical protein